MTRTQTRRQGPDVISLARGAVWLIAAVLSLGGLYLLLSDAGILTHLSPMIVGTVLATLVLGVVMALLARKRRRTPPAQSFHR
ncbi:hypothetical protein [Haloarchaeobius sp. HRN-SO-5]|uniref:hypothetical protein n=1 Tax=Haloarchaeobius sp. HRN-SO-5 TaxID=3446118 RepID=UPI003EBEBEC4